MKFSTETLNEIKDKISVSQVVEKTVQLKKRGKAKIFEEKGSLLDEDNLHGVQQF